MTREETLKLIDALLARPNVIDDARRAFAERFPDAPQEMVETATLHVCGDGIDAALDWLASIEQFLQTPDDGLDYAATWHLLYHVYNWQLFEALLPLGKSGITEHLKDLKMFVEEENSNAAKDAIDRLINRVSGDLAAPGIG